MAESTERLSSALADRYQILSRLGEGGMATVYLAEDLKHKRQVAVKVLKPELAAVLGAERFVQEITTTASLQHPHILPLFDSGEADSFLYYVMPYIEGETLRSKLDRENQLGVTEAVRIASEVADALDYAHRQGVIHRDIKPENILLHDGRPMVADFGIALALSAAAGGRMTETGLSLGTPHYMSPEQATAEKEISARSDVYSLGSVLYEMLAGEPPHLGGSAQQIIMKIISEEAQSLTALRKSVPVNVAAAVGKSLEKLPADRFESASAFAEALGDQHFTTQAQGFGVAERGARSSLVASMREGWLWVVGLMAISGVAGWMLRPWPTHGAAPVTRFTIPVPGGHDMAAYLPNLAVSDDGRVLAYVSDGTLYKRRLEWDEPEALGKFSAMCCLRFSSDGKSIFAKGGFGLGDYRSVPIDGGSMVDLSSRPIDEDLVSAGWGGPGTLLRRAGDTIWTEIAALDSGGVEGAHGWPQLLESGQSVLFTILGPSMMWHDASIVVQDIESGERTTVVTGGTYGRYIPTGHVVYIRADGTVEAIPFDLERRRVTGNAFTIEEGVRTGYWGGAGSFTISDAGTFAFVRGSTWQQHLLTWVDREGSLLGHVGQPVTVEGIRLSPDERHAVTYVASPNADIARFDVATGEQRRLTFDTKTEDNPIWSPDGRRVAYRKIVAANDARILAQAVDGQGEVEQLFASADGLALPEAWSPDGSAMAVGTGGALFVLHIESQRIDTVSNYPGGRAKFSPNGRWLAYTSSETGRGEVYVTSYPGLAAKQQISMNGGRLPEWSAQSGELFFLNRDTMMVSSVSTENRFEWTTPRALFAKADFPSLDFSFSVSADGQRFLYPAQNPDAPAREIHVVLNWFEELRAREAQ
jgi:tRNA A-37 threonylcarbamoyl transferase component Bud32